MQIVEFFGKRYMWLVDQHGKLYLGSIGAPSSNVKAALAKLYTFDDEGRKKDYSNDEGTHHWFDCPAVQPTDSPAINQFRRTALGSFDEVWRRSGSARPL